MVYKPNGRPRGGNFHHRQHCGCAACSDHRKVAARNALIAETAATQIVCTGKINMNELGEAVGLSPHTISRKLSQDQNRDLLLNALRNKGFTEDKLAETLLGALDAYQTKIVSYEGRVTEKVKVPDFGTRLKAFETAERVRLKVFAKDKDVRPPPAAIQIVAPTGVEISGHKQFCDCKRCSKIREIIAEDLLERSKTIPAEFRVTDENIENDKDDGFDPSKGSSGNGDET